MIFGDSETTEKVEYEDLLKNYYEKMEIIEEQGKEIERLKELCDRYEEEHKTTFEEWKKTINIINELEKELEERYLDFKDSECEEVRTTAYEDISILQKIKELKGSDKE